MSDVKVLKQMVITTDVRIKQAKYRQSMFPQEAEDHRDYSRRLRKESHALTNAINALEQKDALERVRDRVTKESSCGVMRSMPMTDRANAMKDVLAFIDHELSGVEGD
jgi:hypothetical protein